MGDVIPLFSEKDTLPNTALGGASPLSLWSFLPRSHYVLASLHNMNNLFVVDDGQRGLEKC